MSQSTAFRKQLVELRTRLGLSQEELAARLNVSFATVNRWENAKSEPQAAQKIALEKLAEEAGVDSEQVIPVSTPLDPAMASTRRRRGAGRGTVLSTKSMEQMLWDAACSIRGEKDAPKFKDYLLPLLFLKRLSDVFEDELKRLGDQFGSQETAIQIIEADRESEKPLVRFYIPPEARWPVIRGTQPWPYPDDDEKHPRPKTLGEHLTTTVRALARANSALSGVIDIVDFNETRSGEREISDQALRGVIETFSEPRYRLGLADVEPDFLGRAYEYLLRKFAEGQGQSAGEFFTPQEVGWLIAYLMRPRPGEEALDYACGSAGLLVKLQLALKQIDPLNKIPLRLHGQELTGSSYAIARMNMVIHDMEGEILRGDSMRNPKFRAADTSLRAFDLVVANPMWNQPFEERIFEHDPFDRFESTGGLPPANGDWAWLQHTFACLKSTGRAAVVIDTGAVTRGSGSKNENREKTIRRWFVEQDLVEGVVLLPDNLFYNTTAPGLIVLLNRRKPAARAGRIVLVNASREARKGQPKNYLPEAAIKKIADAFHAGKDVDKFVKVITREQAAAEDYNLSPSRYIATSEDEVFRPIPEILAELAKLDTESAAVNREVGAMISKLKNGNAK